MRERACLRALGVSQIHPRSYAAGPLRHRRGYNIGIRIVDEFCAKNRGARCRTFKEAMESVAKVRGLTSTLPGNGSHVRCVTSTPTPLTPNPPLAATQDAFRMFLGVSAVVEGWNAEFSACTLRLPDNPLADFVELPPSMADLRYSNLIAGVLRGAMEMASTRARRPSWGATGARARLPSWRNT